MKKVGVGGSAQIRIQMRHSKAGAGKIQSQMTGIYPHPDPFKGVFIKEVGVGWGSAQIRSHMRHSKPGAGKIQSQMTGFYPHPDPSKDVFKKKVGVGGISSNSNSHVPLQAGCG